MLQLLIYTSLISLISGDHVNHALHKALGPGEEEEHHYYKRTLPYNHPEEVLGWPFDKYDIGQISAVDVYNGAPIIFHRGTTVWTDTSFNSTYYFQDVELGPIQEDTIVLLDPKAGSLISSFGANTFYMPHGLSVDPNGSIWVTDVALHQVFKFPSGSTTPSLILGQKFSPGSSNSQFCQPTDVAVSSSGHIFVSDGYCNSRIMKFDSDGVLLGIFGEAGLKETSSLAIPHSLTLIEDEDVLCVADREHQRLLCISAGLTDGGKFGEVKTTVQGGVIGRVFGVAFDGGERLYVINGPSSPPATMEGLTIDLKNGGVVMDTWSRTSTDFLSPHDLALDMKGGYLYVSEIGPYRLTQFKI